MAWVLDLDGVVWLGTQVIPGAAEAVDRLRAAGEQVLFVTNNSFATLSEQEEKLASFGIDAAGRVVTSAVVGASLVDAGERVVVLGGAGIVEAVRQRGATVVDGPEADVVLVGLDRALSYDRLDRAARAVRSGARFVATNTDATYPTSDGLLPGGGAMVAAVAVAAGVEPLVAGKPHTPAADLVRARLGSTGVMVGDRPETDGRFARALGYRFGLVLSGVTRSGDLPVDPEPDLVAADLLGLVVAELDGAARP
jgi:HAD superfamily hydrolase (TIGR01450 family)